MGENRGKERWTENVPVLSLYYISVIFLLNKFTIKAKCFGSKCKHDNLSLTKATSLLPIDSMVFDCMTIHSVLQKHLVHKALSLSIGKIWKTHFNLSNVLLFVFNKHSQESKLSKGNKKSKRIMALKECSNTLSVR